jgi:phospholipase/lecithinase/hemolysin
MDLYITWAGGNDMRGLVGATNPLAVINAQLDSFVEIMNGLLAKGVGTLLVPNLPNLGKIPEFAGSDASVKATAASRAWNAGLEQRLINLSTTTPASIFYLDVFGIFGSILDNPAENGFTNTTKQCRSVSKDFMIETACDDADTFLFWDDIHPTTAAHARLGLEAFNLLASGNSVRAVPEPAVMWLMLLGLGAIVGRRVTAAKAA